MRILDVGCGTGNSASQLLKKNAQVFAVDLDFDAVSTARLLFEEGICFIVANAERLPFGKEQFDEVHCIDVLHWAENEAQFEAMWGDCLRVLKPEGLFFVRLRCAQNKTESAMGITKWFLPDSQLLDSLAEKSNAEWFEPLQIKPGPDSIDEGVFTLKKKMA